MYVEIYIQSFLLNVMVNYLLALWFHFVWYSLGFSFEPGNIILTFSFQRLIKGIILLIKDFAIDFRLYLTHVHPLYFCTGEAHPSYQIPLHSLPLFPNLSTCSDIIQFLYNTLRYRRSLKGFINDYVNSLLL